MGQRTCQINGCEKRHFSRGWCEMHYARWRRHGDVHYRKSHRNEGPCDVEGCDLVARRRGWCEKHYRRWLHNGSPTALRERAERVINYCGYVMLLRPDHPAACQGRVPEHRWVMEQAIGRELRPEETVHHRNGQRHDNRLENLELWSSSHPPGQRVADKVAWAVELLSLYRPQVTATEQPGGWAAKPHG